MTAQSLLSSTILKRVMTVFLFVLTQKRVMAPSNDNVLGLMRVMCGTRVALLSFGTREYVEYAGGFYWCIFNQFMTNLWWILPHKSKREQACCSQVWLVNRCSCRDSLLVPPSHQRLSPSAEGTWCHYCLLSSELLSRGLESGAPQASVCPLEVWHKGCPMDRCGL